MADLKGAQRTPPGVPKFFQFHAVFRKIWQNRMLAPPGGWSPLLGEILDPPLAGMHNLWERAFVPSLAREPPSGIFTAYFFLFTYFLLSKKRIRCGTWISLSPSESLARLCKTSVNSCPTIALADSTSSDRTVDNSNVNNSKNE